MVADVRLSATSSTCGTVAVPLRVSSPSSWYVPFIAYFIDTQVAIYHKALLRKDASGVITKEGEGEDEGKKSASEGKVVNLMAGDANRCVRDFATFY